MRRLRGGRGWQRESWCAEKCVGRVWRGEVRVPHVEVRAVRVLRYDCGSGRVQIQTLGVGGGCVMRKDRQHFWFNFRIDSAQGRTLQHCCSPPSREGGGRRGGRREEENK